MKSLKTIRKNKCSIAFCGVLAIFLVVAIELLCNLQVLSFDFSNHHATSSIENHSHEGHHDHHAESNSAISHEHHGHGAEEDGDEGCCDDLTARFFASLLKVDHSGPSLEPLNPHILFGFIFSESYRSPSLVLYTGNIEIQYLPHGPPGLGGRTILVQVCSLLI
ncbi:MAG TPA: hypothetical protein PKJ63_00350 [Cyclobacteriaceae bacterium]|nr:hypothetical protein [Cyclobacteriaceae bacterium]